MRGMGILCLSFIHVFNINDPTLHLQLSIPQVQAFVTARGETIQVQQKPVSLNLYKCLPVDWNTLRSLKKELQNY